MKANERQWKQLGFDKDPQPTGFPWALVIQIIQVILALIAYLAKRDPSEVGKAELARLRVNLTAAAEYAKQKPDNKEQNE